MVPLWIWLIEAIEIACTVPFNPKQAGGGSFGIFLTFPSTQTKKVIDLIFFSMSWPWKIGLWTWISTLYLFSKAFFSGGGPPQSIHRFRPPRLYRVNNVDYLIQEVEDEKEDEMIRCLTDGENCYSMTSLFRPFTHLYMNKLIEMMAR